MPDITDVTKYFPSATQTIINRIWSAVPENERRSLEDTFKGLPLDKNPLNALIDLAVIQFKTAFGKARTVAIIGPANVGKSTLFNQFIRSKNDKAVVGPIPGTTRLNQEADAGMFAIIDTPGADAVGGQLPPPVPQPDHPDRAARAHAVAPGQAPASRSARMALTALRAERPAGPPQ